MPHTPTVPSWSQYTYLDLEETYPALKLCFCQPSVSSVFVGKPRKTVARGGGMIPGGAAMSFLYDSVAAPSARPGSETLPSLAPRSCAISMLRYPEPRFPHLQIFRHHTV